MTGNSASLYCTIRFAWRDIRGGIGRLHLAIACLALGALAVSTVGAVKMSIERGIVQESAAVLGGDVEIRLPYRQAEADEHNWMRANSIAISEIAEMRSMAAGGWQGQDPRIALVQIKAVDDHYPLYGQLRLQPRISISQAIGADENGRYGVIAKRELVERLGLEIGDEMRLGGAVFTLRALLQQEPDGAEASVALGPRVIVAFKALEQARMLEAGSLFDIAYRLKTPAGTDLPALKSNYERAHLEKGTRWRDRRDGAPRARHFLKRLGSFLLLVGLSSLILGGVGVGTATKDYLAQKRETIAILKTIGATGGRVSSIFLLQITWIALLGAIIGSVAGGLTPILLQPILSELLPVPIAAGFYIKPIITAFLFSWLAAFIFALWPLARASKIRAAGLFRDNQAPEAALPSLPYILVIMLLVAIFATATFLVSEEKPIAIWFLASVAAMMTLLAIAGKGAQILARILASRRWLRNKPSAHLAMAALATPGGPSISAIIALGLGLSVLAIIGQVDHSLRQRIEEEIPKQAPDFFFLDIRKEQLTQFTKALSSLEGFAELETSPMVRGHITFLRGIEASKAQIDPSAAWVLNGDRGVSFADRPPKDSEIIHGKWWDQGYRGIPLVSFAHSEGHRLGLNVGDNITVDIFGKMLTAKVANMRTVDWRSMRMNFMMIFNENALTGVPYANIATLYLQEGTSPNQTIRTIAQNFPNVTAINVSEAIDLATNILGLVASAARWASSSAIVTGLMVLIAAAYADIGARTYEAAIAKSLGAKKGVILYAALWRNSLIGVGAAIAALVAGWLGGRMFVEEVLQMQFSYSLLNSLQIVFAGVILASLGGIAFVAAPLRARPSHILRTGN